MSDIIRHEYPLDDGDYTEYEITEVTDYDDAGWGLLLKSPGEEGKGCIGLSIPNGPITPEVGHHMRSYGSFGRPVRGVFVDGVEFYYRTPGQQEAHRKHQVDQQNAKDQETADAEAPARDERWAKLPQCFQDRKARFMRNNPTWRRDFEPYELMTCEEAVNIAETLKTAEAVNAWNKLEWGEQSKQVTLLDDGHSGNSLAIATRLAWCYLKDPDLVVKHHGALSPLVGSEAYGDIDVDAEASDE